MPDHHGEHNILVEPGIFLFDITTILCFCQTWSFYVTLCNEPPNILNLLGSMYILESCYYISTKIILKVSRDLFMLMENVSTCKKLNPA